MTERTPAVEAAIQAELRLLDPGIRRSPRLVDELLHPEFTEFGASGRRWDRDAMIESLAAEADSAVGPGAMSHVRGVELAPDVVHLTYDTDVAGRRAHRSSLWRLTERGWRLYFHQGTRFGADAPPR
ncbi:nuclear transport factor 2 family protein [Streptomyces sp. NPDC002004]